MHDAHRFTANVLNYASSDSAAQRAFLASLPPAVGATSLPAVPLGDLPASPAIETLLFVEAQRSVSALTAVLSGLKSTTNLVAFLADLFGVDMLWAACRGTSSSRPTSSCSRSCSTSRTSTPTSSASSY
ncbi:hypothetical protein BAE44_0016777 [Dichanthelium oligosanthes]|uniref:Uncharacterized protein n=1 Tax=Dichanthelium oligosanthes TaxID=888268 RepID=A0A1E5VB15_9POAL|nr:hypothetical protein BAE44_0016777 [Dichanthelium oligosanthes]